MMEIKVNLKNGIKVLLKVLFLMKLFRDGRQMLMLVTLINSLYI